MNKPNEDVNVAKQLEEKLTKIGVDVDTPVYGLCYSDVVVTISDLLGEKALELKAEKLVELCETVNRKIAIPYNEYIEAALYEFLENQ